MLNDEQVADRVNTTLKLSNVTGDSAEQVSSYMTAIWNNFADGSQSLESFADKITALGAATASSSAEIANGLQQFAAIGNTVGLSYDYAATALATVVAQTRQSETVVGNAFRTIFSRLQGLSLGETLEDGTDLNKYSKALASVGVNIKDATGNLRSMDNILDDLGAKWKTLSKDQQAALAQTVGGIRQYTQLIALMDNWDKFQQNLQITQNSEGTLDKQAEIYAESWEAARKRVQASWQAIYQDLLDDKFFIGLISGFSKFLDILDKIIDSMGGLKGTIALIGTLVNTVFAKQMVSAIQKTQKSISETKWPWQKESLADQRNNQYVSNANTSAIDLVKESLGNNNITTGATVQVNSDLANLYAKINILKQAGLETDQKEAQAYAEILEHTGQILTDTAKEADNTSKTRENTIKILQGRLKIAKTNANLTNNPGNAKVIEGFRKNIANPDWLKHISSAVNPSNPILTTTKGGYNRLLNIYQNKDPWDIKKDSYNTVLTNTANNIVTVGKSLGINERYLHVDEFKAYLDAIIKNETALKNLAEAQDEYKEAVAASNEETEEAARKHEDVAKAYDKLKKSEKEVTDTQQLVDEASKGNKFEKFLVNLNPNNIVTIAQGFSQITLAVSSAQQAIKIFQDDSLSTTDKIEQAMPSLISTVTTLAMAYASLDAAFWPITAAVAALYGLVAVFKKVQESTPEGKLKKATEALEEQKKKTEEAKNAFEDLKASVEDYKDADDALNKLVEGSEAWKEKLVELNDIVLKLLQNYPKLAQYVDVDQDGRMSIRQEGFDEILAEQQAQLNTSRQLENLKTIDKNNAKNNTLIGNTSGDLAKATNLPQYQSAYDKIMKNGSLEDLVKEYFKNPSILADDNKLKEILGKNGTDENIQAIRENSDILEKANATLQANTEANNLLNTSLASSYLSDNLTGKNVDIYNNSEYKDSINSVFANRVSSFYGQNLENFKNQTVSERKDSIRNLMGADDVSNNGKNYTVDGVEYNLDDINSLLANLQSEQDAIKQFDDIAQGINKVGEAADKFGQQINQSDFGNLFTQVALGNNDLSMATQDQVNGLKDYVENLANDGTLNETLANLGIDDANTWIKNFNQTLNEYDPATAAQNILDAQKAEDESNASAKLEKAEDLGLDKDELSDDVRIIQDLAEASDELDDNLAKNKSAATGVAIAQERLNKGILNLAKSYDDCLEAINNNTAGSDEYNDAILELEKNTEDLLNLDYDTLSADFVLDNLDDIRDAADGDTDAIERLRSAAAQQIVINAVVDAGLGADVQAQVTSQLESLQSMLDSYDLKTGVTLDDSQFIAAANEMISKAQLTADQVSNYFKALGYDVDLDTVTRTVTSSVPGIGYQVKVDKENGFHLEPYATEPLSVDTEVSVPVVKTLTYNGSAGGNISYSNTIAGGGGRANRSSSKKGGGGSKNKTTKDYKDLEQQEDRYHNIKELLSDINTELSRIDKIEDRVYGKARLKYMDQNIDKLKQQLKLTDEYIAEIKGYAAKDQAKLSGIGMGAQYDANGRLTNYEEVLQNIVADYNSAINTYNTAVDTFNASAQEDSDNAILDAADKTVDAAKKKYDENKKILDQYEDTYNLLQEQLDKRIDQVWALFDKRLEEITYSVEFQLDWNDRDVEYFDWLLKYIGKDSTNASDAIANLAQQMNEYGDSIDTIKEGIKGIFGLHGLSFNFDNPDAKALYQGLANFMDATGMESQLTQDEGKALEDYMSKLMDYYTKMDEAWQNAHEHLMDAWSDWNDKLEDGITSISNYGDEMAHIQKIIDATGQKMLRLGSNDLNKMNQQIVENAQEQLKAEKSLLDAMEPSVERAKKAWQDAISAGLSKEVVNKLEEEYKQMRNDYNNQLNDYYSAWEDTLDKVEDAFSRALDNMENDYNNTFSKLGLNYLSDEFDRQKDIRDLYLDDYEKYHELNKSAKELAESLEKTTNNMIRGKMVDLQDEINAKMNTGVKISEAEAEIIARRVALLQAEADLMDAQNAKSAVRMTRDNEGNFSYTYTADQDAIDDAQENYGDKFYDLLDYERNYMDQIQQEMLEKRKQFLEDLRNIAEEYKDDPEAYAQAYAQLLDDYNDYNDYFIDQQQMDFDEMARLRDDDWQDTENLTNLKLAEQDDFITQFHDSVYGGLVPDYQTAAEEGNNWADAMQTACDSATQAITTYEQNSKTTYEAAGQDIEKYGQKAGQVYDDLAQKSENTANEVANDGNQMSGTMAQIQNDAWNLDAAWGSVCDSIRNQIAMTVSALSTLLQSLDRAVSKAQTAVVQLQQSAQQAQAAQQAIQNAQNSGSSGNGNNNFNPQGNKTVPNTGVIGTAFGALNGAYNQGRQTSTQKVMNLYKQQFGFDTGGYTGRWGSDGRLAMLHEKELVLNKEDTANMLDMVNTVRDMVTSIGSNGMLDKTILSAANAAGMIGPTNANLDQNVHIEASFPNVESHTEIETALNNLINSASQYVNRR